MVTEETGSDCRRGFGVPAASSRVRVFGHCGCFSLEEQIQLRSNLE